MLEKARIASLAGAAIVYERLVCLYCYCKSALIYPSPNSTKSDSGIYSILINHAIKTVFAFNVSFRFFLIFVFILSSHPCSIILFFLLIFILLLLLCIVLPKIKISLIILNHLLGENLHAKILNVKQKIKRKNKRKKKTRIKTKTNIN